MEDYMMPVEVDGKVELRRVISTSSIQFADGSEVESFRHPELFDGEFASYTLDGRPPVILRHLSE